MRRQGIWITDQVEECAEWCDKNVEYSYFTLLHGGSTLAFYPQDEAEEVLFRLKWAHLIAW